MTDRDAPEQPSPTTARLRLERTVREGVQELAASFDLAFLEADRLLGEGDEAGAAESLQRQQAELAGVDERLRRAVADAMVERAAEQVMSDALDDLGAAHARHLVGSADQDARSRRSRLRDLAGRVPTLVAAGAAVLVALTAMLAGPREVNLEPVANEDSAGQGVDDSVAAPNTPTASSLEGATASAGSEDDVTSQDAGTDVTAQTPDGPAVAPEIMDLVDRVLAEATSTVFEEVAQSPLLDGVAGEDLEVALALLEQRLEEASDAASEEEPTTEPAEEPTPAPTEAATDDDPLFPSVTGS